MKKRVLGLLNKSEREGEDVVIGTPQGMVHHGHVGFSKEKGLETSNLPPPWDKLFDGLDATLKQMGVHGLTRKEAKLLLRMASQNAPQLFEDANQARVVASQIPAEPTIGLPTNVRKVEYGHIPSSLKADHAKLLDTLTPIEKQNAALHNQNSKRNRDQRVGKDPRNPNRSKESDGTKTDPKSRHKHDHKKPTEHSRHKHDHKKSTDHSRHKTSTKRHRREKKHIRHLKTENARLKKENIELTEQLATVKQKMSGVTKIMFAVEDEKRDLEIELSEAKLRIATAPQSSRSTESQAVDNNTRDYVEEQILVLRQKFQEDLAKLKTKYTSKEAECNSLEEKISEFQKQLDAERNEKEQLLEDLAQMERKIEEMEERGHYQQNGDNDQAGPPSRGPPSAPSGGPPELLSDTPPSSGPPPAPTGGGAPPAPSGGGAPPAPSGSAPRFKISKSTKAGNTTQAPSGGTNNALLAAITNPGLIKLKSVDPSEKKKKEEIDLVDDSNPLAMIAKALIARREAIDEMGGESSEEDEDDDWDDWT